MYKVKVIENFEDWFVSELNYSVHSNYDDAIICYNNVYSMIVLGKYDHGIDDYVKTNLQNIDIVDCNSGITLILQYKEDDILSRHISYDYHENNFQDMGDCE